MKLNFKINSLSWIKKKKKFIELKIIKIWNRIIKLSKNIKKEDSTEIRKRKIKRVYQNNIK